jgi:hypothetical protein
MYPEIFGRATTMIAELDKQTPEGLAAAAKIGCEAMGFVQSKFDLPKRLEKAFQEHDAIEVVSRVADDIDEYLGLLRVERQVLERAGAGHELALFVLDNATRDADSIRERLRMFARDKDARANATRDLAEGIERLKFAACLTSDSLKSQSAQKAEAAANRKKLWRVARAVGWVCLEQANALAGASISPPWMFVSLLVVAAAREWTEKD